jgi:hypothetical protein
MAKTLLSAASVLILAALSAGNLIFVRPGPETPAVQLHAFWDNAPRHSDREESYPLAVQAVAASEASTTPEGRSAGVRVPEETVLRARLKEFWQAVGAHDIVKRYEMTTPTVRARVTLEEFRKTWSWQERPEFPPQNMTAKLSKVCSCAELRLLRCVLSVELTIEKPGEPPTHERTAQMWEFADGQWYEAYSGAPSGRRCPGER